jgi:hypothetical protein
MTILGFRFRILDWRAASAGSRISDVHLWLLGQSEIQNRKPKSKNNVEPAGSRAASKAAGKKIPAGMRLERRRASSLSRAQSSVKAVNRLRNGLL